MADDVVGSASVTIEPDFEQFASMLEAALGPALNDAVSAVNAAAGDMSSAMEASAGDIGSALEDAISTAATSAADSVSAASDEMSASLESVGEGADGIADAIASGAEQAADSLTAIDDGVDTAKASLADLETEGGGSVSGLADTITAVALGTLLADGIEEGVEKALEALKSIVEFLPDLGEEYEGAFLKARVGAGATGTELKGLEEATKDLFAKTPASLEEVSGTLVTLKQRLNLTGEGAQDLGLQLIKMARINKDSVSGTVEKATQIFNNFRVATKDQEEQLNKFQRVSQITGVTTGDLLSQMKQVGPTFKASGFAIDETASIIGGLTKVGLKGMVMQRALMKVARETPPGQSTRERWDQISAAVMKAGETSDEAAVKMANANFGPMAGPKIAAAILANGLQYQETTKVIQSGGDTINAAAAAASNWHSKLTVMTHQLKNVVEPIASAVFAGLGVAVQAVMAPVAAIAKLVGGVLSDAFNAFLVIAHPVWVVFDEIRTAFKKASEALDAGMGPMWAIVAFFKSIGQVKLGFEIVQFLQGIGQAATDLWAALQPVRDAIKSVFDTVVGAVKTFVAANPEAVFAGVATVLAILTGPTILAALGALAGLIVWITSSLIGLVGAALLAAAPFVAIAAGVALVIVAFKKAYTHFKWFQDAVDAVVRAVKDGLIAAFDYLSAVVNDTIIPVVKRAAGLFADLWDAISSFDLAAIGAALAAIGDAIGDALAGIWDNVVSFSSNLGGWIMEGVNWLVANGPGLLAAAGQMFLDFVLKIPGWLGDLGVMLLGWMKSAWQWVSDNWKVVIGGVLTLMGGLPLLLVGYLGNKFGPDLIKWVVDAFNALAAAFPGIVASVKAFFVALPGKLVDWLGPIGATLVGWVTTGFDWLVANLPGMLGDLASFIIGIDAKILGWLGNIGLTLVGWLLDGFVWLVTNLPGMIVDLASFIIGLDVKILGWLGNIGLTLVGWLADGFVWLVTSMPGMLVGLASFLISIPMKIVGWLGDLGSVLFDWMKAGWDWLGNNWGEIIAFVLLGIAAIPGLIIGGLGFLGYEIGGWLYDAFDWAIKTLDTAVVGLYYWFTSLGTKIGGWLGDLGSLLWGWAKAGFDWLTTSLPGIIVNLAIWVGSLELQILGWLGDLGATLFQWFWDAIVWLVTEGPSALLDLTVWLGGLPMEIVGWLGDLGVKLVEWMADGFDWLVEQADTIISGLLSFFTGVGDKIGSAAKGMWEGLKEGLIDAVNWIIEQVNKIPGVNIELLKGGSEAEKDVADKVDKKKAPKKKGARKEAAEDDKPKPKSKKKSLDEMSIDEKEAAAKKAKDDAAKLHKAQQAAIQQQIRDLKAQTPKNAQAANAIERQIKLLRAQLDPKKKKPGAADDEAARQAAIEAANKKRIDDANAAGLAQANAAAGSGISQGNKQLKADAKAKAAAQKAADAQTKRDLTTAAQQIAQDKALKEKQDKEALSADKAKQAGEAKAAAQIARGEAAPGAAGRAGVNANGDSVVINVVVEPPPGTDDLWAKTLGNTVGVAAGEAAVRKLRLKNSVRAA